MIRTSVQKLRDDAGRWFFVQIIIIWYLFTGVIFLTVYFLGINPFLPEYEKFHVSNPFEVMLQLSVGVLLWPWLPTTSTAPVGIKTSYSRGISISAILALLIICMFLFIWWYGERRTEPVPEFENLPGTHDGWLEEEEYVETTDWGSERIWNLSEAQQQIDLSESVSLTA